MPNHIKNVLKFNNLTHNDIEFILNAITTIETLDDFKPIMSYEMDFDKIIPEPRTKKDCPDDCLVNKDSHITEDPEKPWFDWYTWHNRYWGTKWNAYDCNTIIGKSYIKLIFHTAWSMPYPVIQKLRRLGYSFELDYADEAIGSNCGKILYDKDTGYFSVFNEEDLDNPDKFARNLWSRY